MGLKRPSAAKVSGPVALRWLTLALVLATAGCGSQPASQSNGDTSAQVNEDAAQAAAAALKASQAQCVTKALNEAVLNSQNAKTTLDSMMGQNLDGCPDDFKSTFVKLRTAVRNYAQTLADIQANNKQHDAAVGSDVFNLGCSLFTGKQCAPSSIQGWVDADNSLKTQDAQNRAAVQSAYDELEAIATNYGVYIHTSDPSSTPSDPAKPAE